MATATVLMLMDDVSKKATKTVTAQDKWSQADTLTRQRMLQDVSYSSSFASTSWKKLPYLLRVNLSNKTWTA